jgi:hypothetical protein
MAAGYGAVALNSAVVRVWGSTGRPVGVGFLVAADLVLTCAHVVTEALALPEDERPAGAATIDVDLPLIGPDRLAATVEHWTGPEPDVAVLRLPSPPPGGHAIRLVDAPDVWGHLMRTFGFPAGRDHGVWHVGRLRAQQAAGWVQAELAEATGYRVSGGFSGGPVWDEELGGVVGMVVVAESGSPPASYLIPTSGLLRAWPPLRDLALPRSPFRGLAAFRESDAPVFHGRDDDSAEVASLVRAEPVVALVGPSGSGKSSLAMAGVIPRLRRDGFAAVVVRPSAGRSPLSALAAELLAVLAPDDSETERLAAIPALVDVLAEQGLSDVLPRVLDRAGASRLLVVVDQFEELLAQRPEAVEELAGVLLTDEPPDALRVLVTLRADFLDSVLTDPRLGPALRRRVWALGPLSREQLRQVISAPVAHLPGIAYEPGLVDRVLADTAAEPGALPLLGFALSLLWERQSAGALTHQAYDEIGGVAGALGRYAEQVWSEHGVKAGEDVARRLFTQLVRVPAGTGVATRRVASRGELGEPEWRPAQQLATTRLLVAGRDTDDEETVELAHEALITAWPRLAAWVEADREFLGWRETLRHDLRRWRESGRDPELLPTAVAMAGAQRWLSERPEDLSPAERGYLAEGRSERRRRARRRTMLVSGIAGVLVLALVLGSLYALQREATQERDANARAGALAGASTATAGQNPMTSIMLALAAYRTAPTVEAHNALMRPYAAYLSTRWLLSSDLGAAVVMQASRDGRVVVTRSEGGRVTVYLRGQDGRVRSQNLEKVQARHVAVNPAGTRIALIAPEGFVVWYDVAPTGAGLVGPAHRVPGPGSGVNLDFGAESFSAALSADGRLLAVAVPERLVWWDLGAGRVGASLPPPAADAGFVKVWFRADGALISQLFMATGGDAARRFVVIDRASGASRTIVDGVEDGTLGSDGVTLVTCRRNTEKTAATYRLHRAADGAEQARYVDKAKDFTTCVFAVDPTGRQVAIQDRREDAPDRGWLLIDLVKGRMVSELIGISDSPIFSTSGRLVAAGGDLLLVERTEIGITFTTVPAAGRVLDLSQAALTDDGTQVVVAPSGGERLQRRSATGPDVFADVPRRQPPWDLKEQDFIRLNPDNTLLAERSGSNVVSIREVSTLREVAHVTTPAPPPPSPLDDDGGDIGYFFDGPDHLVTHVAGTVERWDARTGRRLKRVDLAALGVVGDDTSGAVVSAYPEAGRVAVTVRNEPQISVVDLRTGGRVARLDTGPDTIATSFDPRGVYLAVLRKGGLIELWRRSPLRKEMGPIPLQDVNQLQRFVVRFLDAPGRLMIAANNAVRIYRIDEHSIEQSYDLGVSPSVGAGGDYEFISAARDGGTLLYAVVGAPAQVLSLRPGDWRARLCDLIGHREFTAAEGRLLPAPIPSGKSCS